jgi:vacuolar-type H+-ATPase subunit I/STV1
MYQALLISFNAQKNILSGDISMLLKKIEQKNNMIAKFEAYNHEYNCRLDNNTTQHLATYLNNEHFLSKIAQVLLNERAQLKQLQVKQLEITVQYNTLCQKIDDLNEKIKNIKRADIIEKDKLADSELTEFAVSRSIYNSTKD